MINLNKKRLLHVPMKVRAAALLFIALTGSTFSASPVKYYWGNYEERAPEYVQQGARRLFGAMRRNGEKSQKHGDHVKSAIIVYEDDITAGADAESRDTGIYFPKGSFKQRYRSQYRRLTPEQLATLAHEIAHHYNGDFTFEGRTANEISKKRDANDKSYRNRGEVWFKEEYNAEKRALETLFAEKEFEALESKVMSRCHSKVEGRNWYKNGGRPYYHGVVDTFARLCKQNPNNKKLQRIKEKMRKRGWFSRGVNLKKCESKTCQQRYNEYKK